VRVVAPSMLSSHTILPLPHCPHALHDMTVEQRAGRGYAWTGSTRSTDYGDATCNRIVLLSTTLGCMSAFRHGAITAPDAKATGICVKHR
jgi:hypothetical protein